MAQNETRPVKNDLLSGGEVRKGNVNRKPTTKRPPPPKGQGGKTVPQKAESS